MRPPFRHQNLYYSLWAYSRDRSKIELPVPLLRSSKLERSAEECFGQAIRERRKELGLTQEELAHQSGFHPTYIGQLERGVKSPSLRTVFSLASVLGSSPSALLFRVESLLNGEHG